MREDCADSLGVLDRREQAHATATARVGEHGPILGALTDPITVTTPLGLSEVAGAVPGARSAHGQPSSGRPGPERDTTVHGTRGGGRND